MSARKIQVINPLPIKKKGKKSSFGVGVSPENLAKAYAQMFALQNMVQNHIPMLETENQKKDAEIKKLKILYKLKDEELLKLNTK